MTVTTPGVCGEDGSESGYPTKTGDPVTMHGKE